MHLISYETFASADLRCGTIVRAETFPKARKPAYKVWVDFGSELGILQTSAQITVHYQPDTLIGKKVMGCVNLGEKNIAGFVSQFLLVGFSDAKGDIILATTDHSVEDGQKLH